MDHIYGGRRSLQQFNSIEQVKLLMTHSLVKHLVFIVAMAVSLSVNAQTDPCITQLKDAGTMIEEGRYDEAISILTTTLTDCSFSKEDEITAQKALITAFLAIDDLESADASAATVMKINPNYHSDKLRDPSEMVVLFEKYRPTPVFTVGINGGGNTSIIEASQTYSIVADDDTPGLDNYESQTGFQVGVYGEYRAWKSLWVKAEGQFRQSGYSIDIPNVEGRTIFYNEDLNYFDVSLSAKYYFLNGNVKPYVQAGASYSFLNTALGELSRDDISDIVDRKIQRNDGLFGVLGEVGLTYAINNLTICLGIRYTYINENVNKEGTRYENLPSVFQYYYVDNDFSMNNLQFSLGVQYNLFFKNVVTE
jgi:hypothetical protein